MVVSGGPSGVGGLNCWFCLNGCVRPPLLHMRVHPLRCFSGGQIGTEIILLLHIDLVTYPKKFICIVRELIAVKIQNVPKELSPKS